MRVLLITLMTLSAFGILASASLLLGEPMRAEPSEPETMLGLEQQLNQLRERSTDETTGELTLEKHEQDSDRQYR